jgi:type I restriction enzyme S subunit
MQGEGPTIVIGRKGAYRGVRWSPIAFWVIDTAFFVVPRIALDLTWAYRALSTVDINALDSGSAIPSTRRDDVYSLQVSVPPPEEQRGIGSILATLDDKIESNNRVAGVAEGLATTLFRSWFIEFNPVRAKAAGLAPTGVPDEVVDLLPDSFEDSGIGSIPAGWGEQTLGAITTELRRGIGPRYVAEDGVCVLNQKCIRSKRVSFAAARLHDDQRRSVDGRELQIGDVLVNSTGVGTLGRLAQVRYLPRRTIVDSHITVVRGDDALVVPDYLALSLFAHQHEIEALGEGSTGQTELGRARLAELRLLVPPLNIQRAFAELVAPSRLLADAAERESQTLADLRDLLLPRLISGRIRVPEATGAVERT